MFRRFTSIARSSAERCFDSRFSCSATRRFGRRSRSVPSAVRFRALERAVGLGRPAFHQAGIGLDDHQHPEQAGKDAQFAQALVEIAKNCDLRQADLVAEQPRQDAQADGAGGRGTLSLGIGRRGQS